jgi:hypothetical protein
MRSLLVSASLLGLLGLVVAPAGCAPEETNPPRPIRTGQSGKAGAPAPGQNDTDGEHGSTAPAGPTSVPDPGTAIGSDTWATGKTIASNISINAGSTITISPGATVNVGPNVAITVNGTLKVASTDAHAKLTGSGWAGIIVASGGTLSIDGLDITGAQSAIWTQAGNLDATLTNSSIDGQTAFKMEAGSKLTITSTTVKATAGAAIAGTFVASKMTYDKTTAPGLTLNDAAGSMTISDSVLKGEGGGDYVISDAGKSLKVEYSTISGSHCALHFDNVDQYTIDHVSFIPQQNTYGGMLYGSGAGPNTISSSNLDGIFAMQGTNGPLTIKDSFAGAATFQGTPDPVTPAGARLTDAEPRK